MPFTDPYFEQVYNQKLLDKLNKNFGPIHEYHFDLTITTKGMRELMAKMIEKNRRGEVVMVIPNQAGNILLHTKTFYSEQVYRLMSGGLNPGEPPHKALKREVYEETGFKAKIDRCLAVITYTLQSEQETLPFVSYVFLLKPVGDSPHPVDPTEAIASFKAVPVSALGEVAQKLRASPEDYRDWGRFRAVAHEVAQNLL
jgi:8-oxo-dGTP pyrophosphatase MutT (NUDIX family)